MLDLFKLRVIYCLLSLCVAQSCAIPSGGQSGVRNDFSSEANDLDVVTIKSATGDTLSLQQKSTQAEALKIVDGVYQATGFGNSFLVVTREGNVVIDTSMAQNAIDHKRLLDAVSNEEPKYIIATHAHGDHVGGIPLWRGKDTEVIAQENSLEFRHYQKRLEGFFARRNAAQFGFELGALDHHDAHTGNYDAEIPSTITFDKKYEFKLGELTFQLASAPAETYDALTVWIPEKRAVFVGDLIYDSFPNIYTLRGTKPRWALDYVNSLNDVIALNPEILVPSHGDAIKGAGNVESTLKRYRDAILYVHDATVAGMNAGKDISTLMDEVRLPEELALPEIYGTVKWTVRGIYDGYIGWFDGNPSSMLSTDSKASNATLVKMAGGPDAVITMALSLFEEGDDLQALSLTESVLSNDQSNTQAWKARLKILTKLHSESKNFNEAGWLGYGIRQSKEALEEYEHSYK